MATDEKQCPRCGETIKAAAYLCRYCGNEFSQTEVETTKHNAKFVKVDRLLAETASEYGGFLDNDNFDEIAEETGKSVATVAARARELGISCDDGSRYPGAEETRRDSMLAEARHLAQEKPLDLGSIRYLATKYEMTPPSVRARLVREGIPTALATSRLPPEPVPSGTHVAVDRGQQDDQYGVLQPAANLLGGCVNIWLWLIIIFVLLMAVGVLFS